MYNPQSQLSSGTEGLQHLNSIGRCFICRTFQIVVERLATFGRSFPGSSLLVQGRDNRTIFLLTRTITRINILRRMHLSYAA